VALAVAETLKRSGAPEQYSPGDLTFSTIAIPQTEHMQWTVIIPVKPAATAKSRLGLGPLLARAIALDTVAAAVACESVSRVLVVTSDRTFLVPETELVTEESPAGIDAAFRTGAALAPGSPLAALLGDVPALRPEDLAATLAAAASHPRAFVADREATGTTLVTALAGLSLLTAFGPGSAAAHRALGLIELVLPDAPTVSADVDTVGQLNIARALGLGPATRAALASQRLRR
jgi:2-phospho-L-lactate guanylyltransferase